MHLWCQPSFICTFAHQCLLSLPSIDNALEVGSLKCSATNQATINVNLREDLLSVRGLAATTIKNRNVLCSFGTELVGDGRADESVHLLSLVSSGCLASTDGPNGFISQNDV